MVAIPAGATACDGTAAARLSPSLRITATVERLSLLGVPHVSTVAIGPAVAGLGVVVAADWITGIVIRTAGGAGHGSGLGLRGHDDGRPAARVVVAVGRHRRSVGVGRGVGAATIPGENEAGLRTADERSKGDDPGNNPTHGSLREAAIADHHLQRNIMLLKSGGTEASNEPTARESTLD